MHELSLMRSIVGTCVERAEGRRVKSVRLRVGALSGVEVHALRFCFDVCTEGTVLAGAALTIDEVPGRAECRACGERVALERFVAVCPCEKRARLTVLSGDELLIDSMEV